MHGVRAGGADTPFLDQLQMIRTPWFGVYLHVIHRADEPDPHDHPWAFASLILSGSYTERVWPNKEVSLYSYNQSRTRFSVGRVQLRAAHRIIAADSPVWTLVVTGRERNAWGFYRHGNFVPWREYQGVS